MGKEKIKTSFLKVRKDISFLKEEISSIKLQLLELYDAFNCLNNQINKQKTTPTHLRHMSDTSTDDCRLESLKTTNLSISTGNGGVPTDRQTDTQHINSPYFNENLDKDKQENNLNDLQTDRPLDTDKDPDKISKLLASLDSLKKEIRRKFKRLTDQEMKVFSALYQLESARNLVDYKLLSEKLKLSQSSIRDYIGKIVAKGIPITKTKINNKKVVLNILNNIRQIASLDTIIKLREF